MSDNRHAYINVSKATSFRMKAVRSRNTQPELVVRKVLHSLGYRFRLHRSDLPGNPDIVLPKYKKIIFVHGCFWHGHSKCKRSKLPKNNINTWRNKIHQTKLRDRRSDRQLTELDWDVLTIWECETTDISLLTNKLRTFIS